MEQVIVKHLDNTLLPLQSKANCSTITRLTQTVELLGADLIDITVESAAKLNFYIGDKITIIGRDYTLNTPVKEKKVSERLFTYDLQFEGVQYDLLRVAFSVNVDTTTNEIQDLNGDSLTGDLKMFLDVLLSNANRVFPGKWVLGTYPEDTKTRTETFSETDNCLTVLQALCGEDKYNTEFSIDIDEAGVRTLNIGEAGRLFGFTFEYGRGKGVYELTREKQSASNIITRLHVFGSSRNIMTSKYRASRLCLPSKTKAQSYLNDATATAKYGVWESTKIFEEVYPHRTGTVTAVDSLLVFRDSSMDFDLNAKDVGGNTLYMISGTSPKIHFNTGNLAGYEFEVSAYDAVNKKFTVIQQTDENGYKFPSDSSAAFQVAVGDEYTLIDIYMPQSYITAAENELQTAGQAFLDKYKQPNVQYGISVDSFFLSRIVGADAESNIIWPGDYIPVKDTDIDVDKTLRVKGIVRDLLKSYSYNITIADIAGTVSQITRVISEIKGVSNIVRINNLQDPARARRNWLSAQEVLNMVFDPEGDFYSEKIKPESIDTVMLSVGAKSMQFGLVGTIFQPTYGGAKNRVVYAGGVLTHYAIVDNNSDPRIWTITDGDITLSTDAAYYIYAKCARAGSGGTILFSATKITAGSDPSYYHFLIGVINSVDANNARALALMHGFTTINGRFIKTGRVSSADGNTYFDLDAGEFKGTFKFTSGESVLDAVNSKRRVFVTQPSPPYDIGDLWSGGTSGDLKKCKVAKAAGGTYAAGDWENAAKYTDDTAANLAAAAASTAQGTANTANSAAGAAQTAANNAGSAAAAAQSTANSASSAAANAQSTANTANSAAGNAQATANNAAAAAAALQYLSTALQGSTDISGGLLATNVLLMKTLAGAIVAGMSGVGDDNIGMWAGGTYAQALSNAAKIILRKDGSGQLAGGNISWSTAGVVTLAELEILVKALSYSGIYEAAAIKGSDIYEANYAGNGGFLRLNRIGYNGGTQYFRGVILYDGKGNPLLTAQGGATSSVYINAYEFAMPGTAIYTWCQRAIVTGTNDITCSSSETDMSSMSVSYMPKGDKIFIMFSAPFHVSAASQTLTVYINVAGSNVRKQKINIYSNQQVISFQHIASVTPGSAVTVKMRWVGSTSIMQRGSTDSERILTVVDLL